MLKQLNSSTNDCQKKIGNCNQFNLISQCEKQEKSFQIINQNLSENAETPLLIYIQERTNLISLSLINCNLNDSQISKITKNLSSQTRLSHLSFKSNYLGENENEFPEICKNLTNYQLLKVLDLSENKITNSSCKSIMTVIQVLKLLQEINL